MKNLSCNILVHGRNDFYLLNQNCTKSLSTIGVPVTAFLFLVESFLAAALGVIIYCKYNSISILNLKIRIAAISNTWWIIYYIFVALRSVLNCIRYSLAHPREGFFISDWTLVTVEVLILCFGLNYQRKYRSSAQINDEIDRYSKSDTRNQRLSFRKAVFRTLASSGSLLSLFALVTFISIAMFAITKESDNTIKWFWIYFGFSAAFHATALFLALIIWCKTSTDGPSIIMKILLFCSILLMIPSDIPMFIWNVCAEIHCMSSFLTLFDVWILLKIVASVMLFLAVRLEFLRLQQECQWAMLNEVQRFSF